MDAGSEDSTKRYAEDNKDIEFATTRFEKTLNKEVKLKSDLSQSKNYSLCNI